MNNLGRNLNQAIQNFVSNLNATSSRYLQILSNQLSSRLSAASQQLINRVSSNATNAPQNPNIQRSIQAASQNAAEKVATAANTSSSGQAPSAASQAANEALNGTVNQEANVVSRRVPNDQFAPSAVREAGNASAQAVVNHVTTNGTPMNQEALVRCVLTGIDRGYDHYHRNTQNGKLNSGLPNMLYPAKQQKGSIKPATVHVMNANMEQAMQMKKQMEQKVQALQNQLIPLEHKVNEIKMELQPLVAQMSTELAPLQSKLQNDHKNAQKIAAARVQDAQEYEKMKDAFHRGKLHDFEKRYNKWKSNASYQDYCDMRNYVEWAGAAGTNLHDFPQSGYSALLKPAAMRSYFNWARTHNDHRDDGHHTHDYEKWRSSSNSYNSSSSSSGSSSGSSHLQVQNVNGLNPNLNQTAQTGLNAKQNTHYFNDMYLWKLWQEWKARKNSFLRHNKDQMPKPMKYNELNYMNDQKYQKFKKGANLKEYMKFRRFGDWMNECNGNSDCGCGQTQPQVPYNVNSNRNLYDMNAYNTWRKQNNNKYRGDVYDQPHRLWKTTHDFNDYSQFHAWRNWKRARDNSMMSDSFSSNTSNCQVSASSTGSSNCQTSASSNCQGCSATSSCPTESSCCPTFSSGSCCSKSSSCPSESSFSNTCCPESSCPPSSSSHCCESSCRSESCCPSSTSCCTETSGSCCPSSTSCCDSPESSCPTFSESCNSPSCSCPSTSCSVRLSPYRANRVDRVDRVNHVEIVPQLAPQAVAPQVRVVTIIEDHIKRNNQKRNSSFDFRDI